MAFPLLIPAAKILGGIALGFVGEAIYDKVTEPDPNAPIVEDVEGDFWTNEEVARGYRNKDLFKTAAFVVAGAYLLKNHTKITKLLA